jgi:UPF0271 protein
MNDKPATIDLNADLGEGFPNDAILLTLVSSTSVSCGAHAGGRDSILRTLQTAVERGVRIGAHPGYADRAGFGRRNQVVSSDQVKELIVEQVGELANFANEVGATIDFVKPHGALYNQAQVESEIVDGVIAAVRTLGLPVLALPDGLLARSAAAAGIRIIAEGFPERRYDASGRLVPRDRTDAILNDPQDVTDQVVRLARKGMQTLCIHGDDPRAVEKARVVRDTLERSGIAVAPWL